MNLTNLKKIHPRIWEVLSFFEGGNVILTVTPYFQKILRTKNDSQNFKSQKFRKNRKKCPQDKMSTKIEKKIAKNALRTKNIRKITQLLNEA